jgi:hypothetical protein
VEYKMKRAIIKKDGIVTNQSEGTEESVLAWLEKHKAMGSFGRGEIKEWQEIVPAVIDEDGNELVPAEREEVVVAPAEYVIEIIDISEELQRSEEVLRKIAVGKSAREACQKVLDLVGGYNLEKELTIEQISQMQQNFANAEMALRSGRPSLAKQLIAMIYPDGVIITQELQNLCLELLEDY